METLVQVNMAKKTGLPCPSIPSLGLQFHSGKNKAPSSVSYVPPAPCGRTSTLVGVAGRTEDPFSHPDPICVVEALL